MLVMIRIRRCEQTTLKNYACHRSQHRKMGQSRGLLPNVACVSLTHTSTNSKMIDGQTMPMLLTMLKYLCLGHGEGDIKTEGDARTNTNASVSITILDTILLKARATLIGSTHRGGVLASHPLFSCVQHHCSFVGDHCLFTHAKHGW